MTNEISQAMSKEDRMNNLKLWDSLQQTPEKYTKKVTFGRKFTAIDPMYQIRCMTSVFGPLGIGWTYQAEHQSIVVSGELVLAASDVTVFIGGKANSVIGPVRGVEILFDNREKKKDNKTYRQNHVDTDAFKKATTDALTKILSQFGIGADVFFGLYDDNKYVAKMRQLNEEESEEAKELEANILSSIKDIKSTLEACKTLGDFLDQKTAYKPTIKWLLEVTSKERLKRDLFDFVNERESILAAAQEPEPVENHEPSEKTE